MDFRYHENLVVSDDTRDAQCILCRQIYEAESETNEEFHEEFICEHCKLIVLDEFDSDISRSPSNRRALHGVLNLQSAADMLVDQLSEMLHLLGQNNEGQQHPSYGMYGSRSSRWEQAQSNEGETDSTIAPGNFQAESEASLVRWFSPDQYIHVNLDDEHRRRIRSTDDLYPTVFHDWNSEYEYGRRSSRWQQAQYNYGETYYSDASLVRQFSADQHIRVNLDDERQIVSTDGPMPMEFNGWNSDHEDEEWEMGNVEGVEGDMANSRSLPDQNIFDTPLVDMEDSEFSEHVGYLDDESGFEELLEYLAENETSRRGAPPAAAASVRKLPLVCISKRHQMDGTLLCAVCKDSMNIGTVANQLPCSHIYHPRCILPWLAIRNTCPVCRYELPTDDPDYEEATRNVIARSNFYATQQQRVVSAASYPMSDGSEVENRSDPASSEPPHQFDGPVWAGWMSRIAAPIAGIVGIVLVAWFQNSQTNARASRGNWGQNSRDTQAMARSNIHREVWPDRSRRMWSLL